MDFDSSSKFIASLAKFLQSLCNGYVDFDKGVEVIGHIYINVDSDFGKKVDYVLNERVCKNDNSITFISNSFHASPAEKPKPLPKKGQESEGEEATVVMEDSGQTDPNSTNVGTIGSYRATSRNSYHDASFSPGSKRPRTPPSQRRMMGRSGSQQGMPQSPRFQDSGGPAAKFSRGDIPPSPHHSSVSGDDYEGSTVFQSGGDEDNYDDQNSSLLDQKPIIEPDISIVKEEYLASQQLSGSNPNSGLGRGQLPPPSPYPSMHPSPSNYPGSTGTNGSASQDMFSNSSFEGAGDPSTLTRAQQEELEMYYRKGTDQHLTFLRNMREAHAMYPFTGKRDKELFEKALAELLCRLPILSGNLVRTSMYLHLSAKSRRCQRYFQERKRCQFKSPGQGGRGGRQGYPGAQFQYGYPGTPSHSGRTGSEAGDSYLQGPGEESTDYQQFVSDDSRDTQHSLSNDPNQRQQPGFHGAFSNIQKPELQQQQPNEEAPPDGGTETGGGNFLAPGQLKTDIKVEVTPMPYLSGSEFELIEIDEDEDL